LKLIVTYNNWTTRTLRFGLLSQDEMMILFGYFYKSSTTAVESNANSPLPQTFALEQNFPNPVSANGTHGNTVTTISYSLPKSAKVDLAIYDVSGKLVSVLVRAAQTAGAHKAVWNARGFASGMYLVEMRAGDFQTTRKILLLR
jgi:hypothetical protein